MVDISDTQFISVVIPVYNGERYLAEAIDSVLTQTRPPDEVVVVDDGSYDESAQIAATFPKVHLLRKVHTGLSNTLNEGVRHTSGNLLAFLDADDRWLPEKLQQQLTVLMQDPSIDLVFGLSRRFETIEKGGLFEDVLLGTMSGVAKSGMLVSRSAFMKVGWFEENPDVHDFLDWYTRAQDAGLHVVELPHVIFERRIHTANMGVLRRIDQHRSYLVTLQKAIARRR